MFLSHRIEGSWKYSCFSGVNGGLFFSKENTYRHAGKIKLLS